MSRNYILTITPAHVRAPTKTLGITHYFKLFDAIGCPQKHDIGKRVYEIDGIYQVESPNQRDERIAAQETR